MRSAGEPGTSWAPEGIQAEVPVESPEYARAARRRFEATLRRIEVLRPPVLDLGPPNALAREMERRYGVQVQHTGTHDLDRERLADFRPGPWATITAFEIFEHLLNPLFVLEGCRDVLHSGGILHVTVPRRSGCEWIFGKSPEHFHEFAPDELRWALAKAGFEIVRWSTANTTPLAPGVRPLLRRCIRNLLIAECRVRDAEPR